MFIYVCVTFHLTQSIFCVTYVIKYIDGVLERYQVGKAFALSTTDSASIPLTSYGLPALPLYPEHTSTCGPKIPEIKIPQQNNRKAKDRKV